MSSSSEYHGCASTFVNQSFARCRSGSCALLVKAKNMALPIQMRVWYKDFGAKTILGFVGNREISNELSFVMFCQGSSSLTLDKLRLCSVFFMAQVKNVTLLDDSHLYATQLANEISSRRNWTPTPCFQSEWLLHPKTQVWLARQSFNVLRQTVIRFSLINFKPGSKSGALKCPSSKQHNE